MEVIERSNVIIERSDLAALLDGSRKTLKKYFIDGLGRKWLDLYDIEHPLCVALCQGAAMHYYDKRNGVKDFDIWFFYKYNQKHLPFRTIWNWDYTNPKFGTHPTIEGYKGRKVDVLVRSLKYDNDIEVSAIIQEYLEMKKTDSAIELSKKGIVLLYPDIHLGKVIWYKGNRIV